MRYEAGEKEQARADGHALVTFDLTAPSAAVAKVTESRGLTLSGPVPAAIAKRMHDGFLAMWREAKAEMEKAPATKTEGE